MVFLIAYYLVVLLICFEIIMDRKGMLEHLQTMHFFRSYTFVESCINIMLCPDIRRALIYFTNFKMRTSKTIQAKKIVERLFSNSP